MSFICKAMKDFWWNVGYKSLGHYNFRVWFRKKCVFLRYVMSPLSDGFITHRVITEMTNKLLLDWNLLSWEEGLECVNSVNPTAEVTKEFVQHRHVRECFPEKLCEGWLFHRWQTKELRYHRYNDEIVQRTSLCVKTLDKESLRKGSETRKKKKGIRLKELFFFFF